MSPSDKIQHQEHSPQPKQTAFFDKLTGLPNRVLLGERVNKAIAQSKRWGQLAAVVRLDLDGLEAIQDRHGLEVGEKVLTCLAHGMKRTLGKDETLAYLEGGKFAAVLPALGKEQECIPALNRLLEAAAEPARANGSLFQLSASIGVTFYPQAGDTDADQLLRQASQAVHRARAAGKNRYHFFDSAQETGAGGHPESLDRVRQGFADREFTLYYQPKVNMNTGVVAGAEALIRWQHPERGLLLPGEFLRSLKIIHLRLCWASG